MPPPTRDGQAMNDAAGAAINALLLRWPWEIMTDRYTLEQLIATELFPAIELLTQWAHQLLADLDEVDEAIAAGGSEKYVILRQSPQRTLLALRSVAELY